MLKIITYDGDESLEKSVGNHYVLLNSTAEIESRFLFVSNYMIADKDEAIFDVYQFDTPMDELIMEEIDHAKRMDTMVVRTPYGTAPLTCLSTGCKFALLVNYYSTKGIKIIARMGSAGGNVFKLMAEKMDVTLYMERYHIVRSYLPDECWDTIIVDDLTLSDFIDKSSELEKIHLKVTYEKLKEIHTNYEIKRVLEPGEITRVPLSLECDLEGLHKLIGDSCRCPVIEYPEEYELKHDFWKKPKFCIKTREIHATCDENCPMVWIIKKSGDFYHLNESNLYDYPDFMNAVRELLDVYESDPSVEEIFMMVFHEIYEQSPKKYYPKALRYGFVYTPKSQTIEVIDAADAVKKMDDIINVEQLEIRGN